MNEGEIVSLLAVVLTGEETYWLCQPVGGRKLPPEWKNCNCEWLYVVDDTEVHEFLPWFKEDFGVVLKLGVGETTTVGRFAVIADSVKARKINVVREGISKTYFILGNDEREVLDDKYDEFLKREQIAAANHSVSERASKNPNEEKQNTNNSRAVKRYNDPPKRNSEPKGNSEAFLWKSLYIVEYGNRVFYVCSAPTGNKGGFRVERHIRKRITVFLLFEDEEAGFCKVGESQDGEKVTASSVSEGYNGRVMMMMTDGHDSVMRKSRHSVEVSATEPPTKTLKKDVVKVDAPQWRPLKAIGVNIWIDFEQKTEEFNKLTDLFPFSSDGAYSVRTAVFSDGNCATYDFSTALKFASKKKVTSSPTDNDMAGLLENIRLAREQFNAM